MGALGLELIVRALFGVPIPGDIIKELNRLQLRLKWVAGMAVSHSRVGFWAQHPEN